MQEKRKVLLNKEHAIRELIRMREEMADWKVGHERLDNFIESSIDTLKRFKWGASNVPTLLVEAARQAIKEHGKKTTVHAQKQNPKRTKATMAKK